MRLTANQVLQVVQRRLAGFSERENFELESATASDLEAALKRSLSPDKGLQCMAVLLEPKKPLLQQIRARLAESLSGQVDGLSVLEGDLPPNDRELAWLASPEGPSLNPLFAGAQCGGLPRWGGNAAPSMPGRVLSPVGVSADENMWVAVEGGAIQGVQPNGQPLPQALQTQVDRIRASQFCQTPPVIGADGVTYLSSYNGSVSAFGADGQRLWATHQFGEHASGRRKGLGLAIHPSGNILATHLHGVTLISPQGKVLFRIKPEHGDFTQNAAIGPDGEIAVCTNSGEVLLLDGSTGKKLFQRDLGSTAGILAPPQFTANGKLVVVDEFGGVNQLRFDGTHEWARCHARCRYQQAPHIDQAGTVTCVSEQGLVQTYTADGKWMQTPLQASIQKLKRQEDGAVESYWTKDGQLLLVESIVRPKELVRIHSLHIDGSSVWREENREPRAVEFEGQLATRPSLIGGSLYLAFQDGRLEVID